MIIRQLLAWAKSITRHQPAKTVQPVPETESSKSASQILLRSPAKPQNATSEHDVRLWHQEVAQCLGRGDFYLVCEPRCDGFAVSLTYEHGVLIRAKATAGDLTGQVITATIRKVSSVPNRLTGVEQPAYLEVLGNLYVPLPDGVKKPQGGRSTLKLFVHDIASSAEGRVPGNQWTALAYLKSAGFDVSNEIKLARTPQDVLAHVEALAKNPEVREFPCTSVAVKVNRFDHQALLASGDDSPSWALFYGFPSSQRTNERQAEHAPVTAASSTEQTAQRKPLLGLNVAVEIKTGQPSLQQVESKVQELGGSIVRNVNAKADYIITDNAEKGLIKARLMRARTVGLRDFIVYCNNLKAMSRLDDIIARI